MQIQAMLERLRGFMDIGAGTISFDKTKEEDWVNNWKKFFKPIRLDEQIVDQTNMGDIRRSDRRYDCCRDRSGNSIWNRFS